MIFEIILFVIIVALGVWFAADRKGFQDFWSDLGMSFLDMGTGDDRARRMYTQ